MKYAKCDLNILVQSNNAGKGSRQNGSVTSGGLAPRAGSVGLRREACGHEVGWQSVAAPSPPVCAGVGGVCQRSRTEGVGVWTGTARASPTVARVGRRPTADLELDNRDFNDCFTKSVHYVEIKCNHMIEL